MIESDARSHLSDLVAATVFPVLSADQLTRLLRAARRQDQYGYLPSDDTEWAASTVYAIDDIVVPTIRNGHVYRVTVGGTSGAVEPAWPTTAGGAITLDGVTYTEVTAAYSVWEGSWDFNRAAAQGWRIKAGLVSNRHTFGSNQGNYNPEQVFEHCNKMADHYAAKTIGSIALASNAWDGFGGIPGAHLEDAQ